MTLSLSPQYDTAQSQSPRSMILRRVNLPTVSYCTESIFPQYHTAQSQSPHIIILHRVNLPAVLYCGESHDFPGSYIKGHSNEIFYLQFFHPFLGHWPVTNGLKYCWFLVKISLSYSNLSVEKTDSNKQNLYTRIFCKIEKYSSLLVE